MIHTGDHGVCEHCKKPGVLAPFRSPVAIETGWNSVTRGPVYVYAIALCVGCAERAGFPRFLDAPRTAVQAVRA